MVLVLLFVSLVLLGSSVLPCLHAVDRSTACQFSPAPLVYVSLSALLVLWSYFVLLLIVRFSLSLSPVPLLFLLLYSSTVWYRYYVLCITHVRRARDSHCLIVAVQMSEGCHVAAVGFVVAVRVSEGSLASCLVVRTKVS